MKTTLRLTSGQHQILFEHLFPGDGKEAVALVRCGRLVAPDCLAFCANQLLLVPHDQCERRADRVRWKPTIALEMLSDIQQSDAAILKIHSHPTGYPEFSSIDDASDLEFFAAVSGWADSDLPHASAIMLPNGRIMARTIHLPQSFSPVETVSVIGDNLTFWQASAQRLASEEFATRHRQMFGNRTTDQLRGLRVAVVGCSGTGSPVIEMLARLGVGHLVLVDPDRVEVKNLNRIFNATMEDAVLGRTKVEVLGRTIARMGLGTRLTLIPQDLADPETIRAVASSDIVVGCMDGARGRSLLNRLCTFYTLPLFDLGVGLEADGNGGISEANGAVHYIQPGRSTLLERGVFTQGQLDAEALLYLDPKEYERRLRAGYIRKARVDSPAVISFNTQVAATAINELLARVHPYRSTSNEDFAAVRISFIHGITLLERDPGPSISQARFLGQADCVPLLDMPMFG